MKKFLESLYLNKYFLAFIVIFAYLESIQIRFYFARTFDWYLFTPEAAIGQLFNALILFVIIGLVIRRFDDQFSLSKAISVFAISLVLYLIVNNLFSFLIALIFNTVERNFNFDSLASSNIKYVLDVFVYGGFFLAHYYFQKYKADQEKINQLEKSQMESQLSKLKAQLDPHFLFNNLNVLDQLIEEDREKASDFLHDFSEIYRYVLKSSDRKQVPLVEELDFAERYFRLMQQKYGEAFALEITGVPVENAFLPPLSLQLLIENAIEHNLGTESAPVSIKLTVDNKTITVKNTLRPKKSPKLHGGRALENLKAQYRLFETDLPVVKKNEDNFEIQLPLIFADVR